MIRTHILGKTQLVALAAAAILTGGSWLSAQDAPAPAPAPAPAAAEAAAPAEPADPTLEQRVADIEAYMNNVQRPTDPPAGEERKVKSNIPGPGPGHNAWQMTSSALVLFMTLPGLFLFYGGLVRRKNVLSVIAQCMGIAGLVAILWWAVGYSLSFGGTGKFLGDTSMAFLKGVEPGNTGAGYWWISDVMWCIFQLTFAIITPALIIGAIAERMKFISVLIFVAIWMFAVYFPFAHMVWSTSGFMCGPLNKEATIKAIDFAGGTVVHMTSGWSALVLCLILGPRKGYGKEPMPPHSMVLCAIGTGMLWVGWYGFNAGSALGADAIASNAFGTTTFAAATAGFTWGVLEWILRGKPSVLGFCSGIVAGLVVITPAAGFVTLTSSVIMGVLAGVVPFIACIFIKKALGYDDSLDTFGVHGVGGTLGAILTGVFADEKANSVVGGLKDGLLMEQLKAVGLTIVWAVVATAVIAFIVKAIVGLRATPEVEESGLDLPEHGEAGYEMH
ncbi:ammonium transporter [Roseimicrobium gellanilyticum]|uniref:Ammonium transporter n=1 Tax=Roseimicrobium gellanilyticum TaxID=748857 RepID=A0A366H0Y6_9BACT|nr:ammonium transporter [Roseimicrobium gellanilyticum]RBP35526.1 ammonium transporter [Roseimicrobium gellanilyticum]